MVQDDTEGSIVMDLMMFEACAPGVASQTIEQIVRVESAGDPLALNVNGPTGPRRVLAKDLEEAVRLATVEIAAGNTVDAGLMQVNSRNFSSTGLTIASAFNPCRNVAAGAQILMAAYERAVVTYGEGQAALQVALSIYNTGDGRRGFVNGYVARYYNNDWRSVAPARTRIADGYVYAGDPTVLSPTEDTPMIKQREPTSFPIVTDDQSAAMDVGVQVLVDPDRADELGLVVEDALSPDEAWASNNDAAEDGP